MKCDSSSLSSMSAPLATNFSKNPPDGLKDHSTSGTLPILCRNAVSPPFFKPALAAWRSAGLASANSKSKLMVPWPTRRPTRRKGSCETPCRRDHDDGEPGRKLPQIQLRWWTRFAPRVVTASENEPKLAAPFRAFERAARAKRSNVPAKAAPHAIGVAPQNNKATRNATSSPRRTMRLPAGDGETSAPLARRAV
jgi:hypothetical protein